MHGQRGEDPLEPAAGGPYPYPPVSHEARVQELNDQFAADGLHPFHLPLGIRLDEKDGRATPTSICIRCNAFDGFPCLLNGKADAQVMCVDPTIAAHPNFTLLTNAYASRLQTDAAGRTVTGVHVTRDGREELHTADIVVVACGALSSALLLLRSASDAHPHGLANGSGQVGRNYMRHNQSVLMALMRQRNDTVFQKTLALSDFYFGADDWEYPLGLIQMCASSDAEQIKGEALPAWLEWFPDMPFSEMASHSMDFWLSSEDLPLPENRIFYDGVRVRLDVRRPTWRRIGGCGRSSSTTWPVPAPTRSCSSAASTSARTSRSAAPRTRPARCASAPTRPAPCSTSTARRTSSTTSTSRTPASSPRSAR